MDSIYQYFSKTNTSQESYGQTPHARDLVQLGYTCATYTKYSNLTYETHKHHTQKRRLNLTHKSHEHHMQKRRQLRLSYGMINAENNRQEQKSVKLNSLP